MISKKAKKIFIIIFILFFLFYIFLNIFYFSKNEKNDIFSLEKPKINLNELDKSISLEKPHYEKKYFIKIFINEFLENLEKQSFPKNENILINFYFNNNEIYVETNLINLNYTYHYYLV